MTQKPLSLGIALSLLTPLTAAEKRPALELASPFVDDAVLQRDQLRQTQKIETFLPPYYRHNSLPEDRRSALPSVSVQACNANDVGLIEREMLCIYVPSDAGADF